MERHVLYPLFFLASGEKTSINPASDPAKAAATELGESKVFGPTIKNQNIAHQEQLTFLLLQGIISGN